MVDSNTLIGPAAGIAISTGGENLCLGHDAGRSGSPGGEVSTTNRKIFLGDENISNFHCQVVLSAASDKRDKTDVKELDLGLEFINKLEPVTYRWDKRSKYGNKQEKGYDLNAQTPDGTHKEDQLDIGFLAQDVADIEASYNYKIEEKTNLTTELSDDGKMYNTKYSKFVPMLVKAVQELTKRIEELESN